MIAACPDCGARYRIDPAKLPATGARLRCSRCQAVFRVEPEGSEAAAAEPVAAPASRPETAPERPAEGPRESAEEGASPTGAHVLIAHPEDDAGKRIADALASWGIQAVVVQDGVEAILQVQRSLPRVVVLDAALPKMFGFQVCELMKRNEQLRSIPVVLVGAIHDRDRYRRPPQELYGADAYIERHELPDALAALFERFGLARGGAAPAREEARPPAPPEPLAEAQAGAPAASPAPPQAQPGEGDVELEKASRLARIIVSDVLLYNPEKLAAGLAAGDAAKGLAAEIDEGVTLFEQRIGSDRFDAGEMLRQELQRQVEAREGR